MSNINSTPSDRQLPPIPLMLADNQLIQRKSGSNCNVAVVGPPGCGKTHSILTPNLLLSTDCPLIVDDKKGVLYRRTRQYFQKQGYRILKFDTVNPTDCSNDNIRFNPFALLYNRDDAVSLANLLLPDDLESKDLFWLHSARALAVCLMEIGMHTVDREVEEFNLQSFFTILHAVGRDPNEEDGLLYDSMRDYTMLKRCAEDTWRSIVITLYADLECEEYRNMLPIPVRFFIDDFASGTRQADFENIIANCRSRNISYILCFQSISQLRSLYGKNADGILDCMEYQVYFGTSNVETNQYLSNAANMPCDRIQRMRSDQVLVLHRCEAARLTTRNRPEELAFFKESSLNSPSR